MSIHTLNLRGEEEFQQNITGCLIFPDKNLSAIWLIEGKGSHIRSRRKKYNIGGAISSAIDSHLTSLTATDLQELYDSPDKGGELFNRLHDITNQSITTFIESKGWESIDEKGYSFKRLRSDGSYTLIGCNAGASMGLLIIKDGTYRGYTIGDVYLNDDRAVFKELSPDLLHNSIIKTLLKHKVSMKVTLLKKTYDDDPELYCLEDGISRNPFPMRRGNFNNFKNRFDSIPNYTFCDVRNNITSYIGNNYNKCYSISSLGFSFLPDICHKCNYSDIMKITGPLSLLSNNIGTILTNDNAGEPIKKFMTNQGTGKVLFEFFHNKWFHKIIKSKIYSQKTYTNDNDEFVLNIKHLMGTVGNTSWITYIQS